MASDFYARSRSLNLENTPIKQRADYLQLVLAYRDHNVSVLLIEARSFGSLKCHQRNSNVVYNFAAAMFWSMPSRWVSPLIWPAIVARGIGVVVCCAHLVFVAQALKFSALVQFLSLRNLGVSRRLL